MEEGNNNGSGRDRFGYITAIVATVLYVAALVFIVLPLPRKLDTFLVMSWLFVPAIVGAVIYIKISRSGGWSKSRELR